LRDHWVIRAPSFVARLYTSNALPLFRFTSTYQAVVSTVAADADVAATVTSVPLTTTAAAAAAIPDRHARRHLTVRAAPTGIASLLSTIWDRRHEARRVGALGRRHTRTPNGPDAGANYRHRHRHLLALTHALGDDPGRNIWKLYGDR
jgi:hypothetical protein